MTDLIGLSHAFISYWNRRDIDAIVAALSDDVVYQNVPLPAVHGSAAVRAFIGPGLKHATEVAWTIHHFAVAADGNKVFTERTDSFRFGDQAIDVPVMGIFEFRGDLICAWRDYADVTDIASRMTAIAQKQGWSSQP
jgi:limonene-1,2-epoxide hydrolase